MIVNEYIRIERRFMCFGRNVVECCIQTPISIKESASYAMIA
jgi:hypothetical protein